MNVVDAARRPPDAVLDTDLLSFLFDRDPIRVPRYSPHLQGRKAYISFISAGEVRFGALLRRWGRARRARLEEFLADYTVIQSSPEICEAWAQIRLDARRTGKTIERQDAWIAATAICTGAPLITHNADHFRHVQLLRVITEPDPRP